MLSIINLFMFAILLSMALDIRTNAADRLLSFGIVRVLLYLPLLSITYLLVYFRFEASAIYHVENGFSLLLMVFTYRLFQVTTAVEKRSVIFGILLFSGLAAVTTTAVIALRNTESGIVVEDALRFSHFDIVYCSTIFQLLSVLLLVWRIESFWRSLDTGEKWRSKYLMLGFALIGAVFGFVLAYRLTYLQLSQDHLPLLAIVLFVAFVFIVYATVKHRLLNRKMFISRKVVYASIAPLVFSGFFLLLGTLALLSRLFGWSIPFLLQWLVVIFGILGISVLALSTTIRRNVRYFISTHFYVNKYEYRDEWLALSSLLQDKRTEEGVVDALYQILKGSLYTQTILIWLGDTETGFRLVTYAEKQALQANRTLAGDDPIICYLRNSPHLYLERGSTESTYQAVVEERTPFFRSHGIVLLVPLILGNQFVGLIGLGPETTGGRYGHDDFDLLSALGSHAASALLAVQNAEKLAKAREQSAYHHLSAFVLHDIKNAATMLDLARENAPAHMEKPEFQRDLLASIDDALGRMGRVLTRLSVLREEFSPDIAAVDLHRLLRAIQDGYIRKLSGMSILVTCPVGLRVDTDSEFIERILENILLNAKEAGATRVDIAAVVSSIRRPEIRIEIVDNGPGISPDLLPDLLFEPFRTKRPNGSGIGLWQVQKSVEALRGSIEASNSPDGGAQFVIKLPIGKHDT